MCSSPSPVPTACVRAKTTPLGWFLGDGGGSFIVGPVDDASGLLGAFARHTADTCGTWYHEISTAPAAPRIEMRASRTTGRVMRRSAEPHLLECCRGALADADIELGDIDCFVPHTPTAWFADFAAEALGFPRERTVDTYPLYANVGPAPDACQPATSSVDGASARRWNRARLWPRKRFQCRRRRIAVARRAGDRRRGSDERTHVIGRGAMSRPTQAVPAVSLPRPRGLSVFHGLRLARDPLGFLDRARAQCGDTFAIALPGDPLRVVTGNPDHVRTIFALPADAYRMANQAIPLNLGRGSLLFLDGDRHQQQHRLLMPPLHGDHLRSYAETIRRTTDSAIDGWPVAEPFELLARMKWVTLTIICECVLGIATRERIEDVRDWTHRWMKGPMSTLAFSLGMMLGAGRVRAFFDEQTLRSPVRRGLRPGRLRLPWQEIGDAKAALVGLLREDLLACRRDGPGDRADVLALLAHTHYETGAPMDVGDAVDQLVTMLVGGYESVANALSWTLHYSMHSPDAWARLRAETADLAAVRADPAATLRRSLLSGGVAFAPHRPGCEPRAHPSDPPRPLRHPEGVDSVAQHLSRAHERSGLV